MVNHIYEDGSVFKITCYDNEKLVGGISRVNFSYDLPKFSKPVGIFIFSDMNQNYLDSIEIGQDQFPPFRIDITAEDEQERSATLSILDVEVLNIGQHLNNIHPFIARTLTPWVSKMEE